MTYHCRAVLLRLRNYGEHSRLLTVYTYEYGKRYFVARSSKKITSKLSPCIQVFSKLDLYLAWSRHLDIVAGVTVLEIFKNLKQNLFAIALVSYCFEILDLFTAEAEQDVKIFKLLADYLHEIDYLCTVTNNRNLLIWRSHEYTLRLMDILGYCPVLDYCVICRRVLYLENYFLSYDQGGLVCLECVNKTRFCDSISAQTVAVFRQVLAGKQDYKDISGRLWDEINRIIPLYVKYNCERELKSDVFLKIFII